MRTALFKTFCKEFPLSRSSKCLTQAGRNFVARCISTKVPLLQTVEQENISEEALLDPLQHHDYFNVRKSVTLKGLFKNYAHFGHVSPCRHAYMKPYLFGSRSGIDIFDLEQTVELFGDALNFVAHVAYRNGVIMFVSRNKRMMPYIEKTAKSCGEYAHCRYWVSGIFTDTYNRLGQNIRLPDCVIFMSTSNSVFLPHTAVTDCAKMLIPTVGIVDSNSDPRLISYPIPANDDTFKANLYYLNRFKNAIEAGKAKRDEDAAKREQ